LTQDDRKPGVGNDENVEQKLLTINAVTEHTEDTEYTGNTSGFFLCVLCVLGGFRDFPLVSLMAGSRLIIVCGLPGSGKTTLAKRLETKLRAICFSSDEWMSALSLELYDEGMREKIEALQWKLAEELLVLGVTVIIEWGTWRRSERDALRIGARALGAAVELHYLSAPADVLFDRIQRRGMENPPIKRDAVLRWFEVFQAPTPEEIALFNTPCPVG
jgi:predicted kinase